jgi:predicted aminopeptidase
MATRSAINPVILTPDNASALPKRLRRATDAKTWKKGELGHVESGAGTITPNTTTAGAAADIYVFAEDQLTATSSTDVWVYKLEKGVKLQMYVTNNGTASAIGIANLDVGYDVYTASNIAYLDLNATSGAKFKVEKICDSTDTTSPMPERLAFDAQLTATAPGLCQVVYQG